MQGVGQARVWCAHPSFGLISKVLGRTSGGTSAATNAPFLSEESVANTVEDKEAVRSVAMRGQSTASSTSSWATNLGNDKTRGPSPRWSLQSNELETGIQKGHHRPSKKQRMDPAANETKVQLVCGPPQSCQLKRNMCKISWLQERPK